MDKKYPDITETYDLMCAVIKKVPNYQLQAELFGALTAMMESINIPLQRIGKLIDEEK